MEGNIEYYQNLIQKKFLFPPTECICGNKNFGINKYSRNINTKLCF